MLRKVFLILAAILFIGAGILHFTATESYMKIMPPYVPWHRAMVLISGAAEIAGGAGLLIGPLRKPAAWGLVALLVAVLPANIYMAMDNVQVTAHPMPVSWLWARVPLQAALIAWVLWISRAE